MAMPAVTFSKLRKFFFSTSRIFPSVLSQKQFYAYVRTVCGGRYAECYDILAKISHIPSSLETVPEYTFYYQ
jgi:hypothetical protein